MSNTAEDVYQLLVEAKQRAFNDPKWFFEEILNCRKEDNTHLEDWQLHGIEVVADVQRKLKGLPTKYNHDGLNRLTLKSCHGPGKTYFLGLLMHWWNYVHYGTIVCTAPKEKQLKTRLWPRYRQILRRAQKSYKDLITVNSTDIKIVNDEDWGCIAETASDPENMAGYHDNPQLFLVDEASARVLDPMFPVIEGALSTEGSVLVIIGNPTRTTGEFWASHNKRGTMELYYRLHIKPEDSRFVSQRWVESFFKKYGPKSPITLVRALGEFPESEDGQLITMGWLESARLQDFSEDGSIPTMRMSIDVADGGEDETVIQVAYLYDTATLFYRMKRYSFSQTTATDDIVEAAEKLFEALNMNKANDDIVVDSIGVGTGVASNLTKKGYRVIRFKGGSTENINTKEYRNHRVRSYLVFRDKLSIDHSIYFHEDFCSENDWDDYVNQVMTIQVKPGLEQKEDLVSKKDMDKSPDMADASAMMFANTTPEYVTDGLGPVLLQEMETANAVW